VQALAATGHHEVSYIARYTAPGYSDSWHQLIRLENHWNPTRGMFLDAKAVYRALQAATPDVIYHRGGTAYSGVVARYARDAKIRAVWHVASDADVTPFRWQLSKDRLLRYADRRLFDSSFRHTDVIVAQTEDQARLLERNYGLRANAVIPNFHPFPPEEIRKASAPEVLWIGNIKPLKRPEEFIQLAADLGPRTAARFIMIGAMQGSDRWRVRMKRAMAAARSLEYRGARTQDEVNESLARAALLVNTSEYEGFSNTFIQAWMRKVPVVSLSVDPDGVLAPGRVGLYSGSAPQLQIDVLRLIEDEGLRTALGEQAQRHAFANHSLDNVSKLVQLLGA
jgi:glycosyltransferase involved in cell wall biosynthesis